MRNPLLLAPALALLALATPLAPPATADPITAVGFEPVGVSWTFGGVSGTCSDDMLLSTTQVNLQLLVAAQTTRGAANPSIHPGDPTQLLPDAMCALLLTITPGAYTNACQILRGEAPTAAVRTDPFFTRGSDYAWHKTVVWASGDYVDYTFGTNYRYDVDFFRGECRWGDATGSWYVNPHPIYV